MEPTVDSGLTPDERQVLTLLSQAWDFFLRLPVQHPMHNTEFAQAIHAAQRIVMCRPVARDEGWVKDLVPPPPPKPVPAENPPCYISSVTSG